VAVRGFDPCSRRFFSAVTDFRPGRATLWFSPIFRFVSLAYAGQVSETSPASSPDQHSAPERLLRLITLLRPGEGRSVLLFFSLAFLILVAYYILKTLREPLLLVDASAAMKSYAYAAIAAILLVGVPLYGYVFRRTSKRQLTRWITVFFVTNLLLFYLLGSGGFDIGFAYYVWVGIVALLLTAQFWAYAADTFNPKSGQRLFPVIMLGATLGGLTGPMIAGALFSRIGAWNLMLLVGVLLLSTLPLIGSARDAVPPGSRALAPKGPAPPPHVMGGFALVFRDSYMLLLACLIVLLNWVNTTGEYILAELVLRHAEARIAADPALSKGEIIATVYSQFYFAVNALAVLLQVSLVARLFRWIGVRGALPILPIVAFLGYGLAAFVPVFAIIRVVKVLENSTDYSLMNTARHALFLPLSAAEKFEGKAAIDTFFWRFGDLIQAAVIFAGLRWFEFGVEDFALLNMVLAGIWIVVARKLGVRYADQVTMNSTNQAPQFAGELTPFVVPAGSRFEVVLPKDWISDPDPGDVLIVTATLADGTALPRWLRFDARTLRLSGRAPAGLMGTTELAFLARDFEGASAAGRVMLKHDE
jgi:AAA family ATP:ADP antiporter